MNGKPTYDWHSLEAATATCRLQAVDAIRDRLIFGEVELAEARDLAQGLLRLLEIERNSEVTDAILDALLHVTTRYHRLSAEWDSLASKVQMMPDDRLEFALVILGNSEDPSFAKIVKPFVRHANVHIREAAETALRTLMPNST
jgi:hypothetical protein